jgi:hypothetical protein
MLRSVLSLLHLLQLAFMFGAMQVAKRIPFEDNPEYIIYARVAYVAAQLFCVLLNYYCAFRVSLLSLIRIDQTSKFAVYLHLAIVLFHYQVKKANDLTVLKYVEPKSALVS